jgi:hypothetical protein
MNAAFRITGAGSVQVAKKTAYVFAVLISCTTAGQVLKIQNGETPNPKILVPAYSLEVAPTDPTHPTNPREFDWIHAPKLMKSGIYIVTTGAGEVTVWIDYGTTEVSPS